LGLEISDRLFRNLAALVYAKSGINLHAGKKQLLCARLAKRLRAVGVNSFDEYYDYLKLVDDGQEVVQMVNAVTTNKTSFFRESDQFDFLEGTVYPAVALAQKDCVNIRFWSAGCSTGEEPYSLAISILEFFKRSSRITAHILATDISTTVLETAARGVYHESRVDEVPMATLVRYFQKGTGRHEGHFRVKDDVRRLVSFRNQNLMRPFFFGPVLDAIFCRNVMIYFNKETQQNLIRRFYDCISPGGYLFVGHSESLAGIEHEFTYIRPTIYRKEAIGAK
jgi:chemotaxis protein methyltransferase CheR